MFYLIVSLLIVPTNGDVELYSSFVGCSQGNYSLIDSFQVQHAYTGALCISTCFEEFYRFASVLLGHGCFCKSSHGALNEGNSSKFCEEENSYSVYDTGQRRSGPPAWIELVNVTERSLELEWDQPHSINSPIDKFIVTAMYVKTYSSNSMLLPPLSVMYPITITKADLLNLHPGTRYNVSVAAYSSKHGSGMSKSDLYWTLVGEPTTPTMPVILKREKDKLVVRLSKYTNENGPVTAYHVVVVRQDASLSFQPELLKSYDESRNEGLQFYIAAELSPEGLNDTFVIGDNRMYGRYHNYPLPVGVQFHVSLGVVSTLNGITKVSYAKTSHEHQGFMVLNVGNTNAGQAENSYLVVGLSVAVGVFGFLLLMSMVAYFVLRRRVGRRRLIPDHQELSLGIEVDSSTFDHSSYVPEEIDERINHYENLKQKVWNVPRNFLNVNTEVLGQGHYGNVVRGTVQQRGFPVPVVVQVIADGELSGENKKSMLQDLDLLIRSSSCDNVINLVGTCENPSTLFVVLEYHPATLKDILLESRCLEHSTHTQQRFCSLTEALVLEIAMGVAKGMDYLHRKKIVHKQLAARNVLMADGIEPKITGFGIAQYLKPNEVADFTRWTAQEIFHNRNYVSKCDVWSFGCLLWEITALGGTPYADVRSGEVPARVMRGIRLPQLHMVGDDLYQLMLQCWQIDLDERPVFQEIVHIIDSLLGESEIHINFALYTGFHYEQYSPDLELQC